MSSRAARKLLSNSIVKNEDSSEDDCDVPHSNTANAFALLEDPDEIISSPVHEETSPPPSPPTATTSSSNNRKKKKKKKKKKKGQAAIPDETIHAAHTQTTLQPKQESLWAVDVRYLDPIFEKTKLFGKATIQDAMKEMQISDQGTGRGHRRNLRRLHPKRRWVLLSDDDSSMIVPNVGIRMEYLGVSDGVRQFQIRTNAEYSSIQRVCLFPI
jgi:hypothetical protein